jgi:hypothetical protein
MKVHASGFHNVLAPVSGAFFHHPSRVLEMAKGKFWYNHGS